MEDRNARQLYYCSSGKHFLSRSMRFLSKENGKQNFIRNCRSCFAYLHYQIGTQKDQRGDVLPFGRVWVIEGDQRSEVKVRVQETDMDAVKSMESDEENDGLTEAL